MFANFIKDLMTLQWVILSCLLFAVLAAIFLLISWRQHEIYVDISLILVGKSMGALQVVKINTPSKLYILYMLV